MLMLTRERGESIHIAKNIVIKVVNVRGKQVCIGIQAPKDFKVLREELLKAHPPLKDAVIEQNPFNNCATDNGGSEVSNE